MTRSRAVLFAVLLVASTVAPVGPISPVGTASAADWIKNDGRCSQVDQFVWVSSVGRLNDKRCDPSRLTKEMKEFKEAEDNQTEIDIYEGAVSVDSQDSLAIQRNYLADSDAMAWSQAQAAVIAAYENGSSESVAKVKARQAVSDYYAQMQLNILRKWNSSLLNLAYLSGRAQNASGIDDQYLYVNTSIDPDVYHPERVVVKNRTHSVELVNGTNVTAQSIFFHDDGGHDYYWTPDRDDGPKVMVKPPTDSFSKKEVLNPRDWYPVWTNISGKQQQLNDNVDAFVNSTYDAYQRGELKTSEFVNPTTLMTQYNTQANETGYWAYSAATLASAGVASPDLNSTSVMTIQHKGEKASGLLFSQNAPNGTWETNVTYDTANINGSQFFVSTSGNQTALHGTFTITSMKNKQGEAINETHTTEYVYQTQNNTEYRQMQEQLLNLTKEIEARQAQNTGSGGWNFGDLNMQSPSLLAVVAIGGGVAVLLLGKN